MTGEILAANWRTTRKVKTFNRIQKEAIRLFLEKGYEQTTIEEIAAATGVSHMTVFRHFATKDALVLSDEYDLVVDKLIRQRPAEEGPIEALLATFRELLEQMAESDLELTLARNRLIAANPSLSGGLWANWMAAQHLVTEALLERAKDESDVFGIRIVTSALLAAGMTAAQIWAENDGETNLVVILDKAITVLREEMSSIALLPVPSEE